MTLATCTITGKLVDVQGRPIPAALVTLRPVVTPVGQGQFQDPDGVAIGGQTLRVQTNELGVFEIAAVRGLTVLLTCEEARYSRRVVVPDVSTIDFRSLTS